MNCPKDIPQHPVVGIIGVGLMGGALGMALLKRNLSKRVIGLGRNPAKLQQALRLQAVTEYTTEWETVLPQVDIAVVCTPVQLISSTVGRLARSMPAGSLITDVGSTKTVVCQLARQQIDNQVYFIGSHPMAGSEKTGVESADADLYVGASIAITPHADDLSCKIQQLTDFWSGVGGEVMVVSAEEHDRVVGFSSHLPHMVAALLATVTGQEAQVNARVAHLVGSGFKDTTRIAAGDADIWCDIVTTNKTSLLEALRVYQTQLDELVNIIEDDQAQDLKTWLQQAAQHQVRVVTKNL